MIAFTKWSEAFDHTQSMVLLAWIVILIIAAGLYFWFFDR